MRRLQAEGWEQVGVVKRYLTVVGIILAVLVGLGIWLKPPIESMRQGVDAGLAEYAKKHLKPGETMPVVSETETTDWLVAVSHSARVGERTFYCYGAFKVTVCNLPDE